MEAAVELEVMGAVAAEVEEAEVLLITFQEQEVQEVLAALEEEVEEAEILLVLEVSLGDQIVVVMAVQEATAEAEGVVV